MTAPSAPRSAGASPGWADRLVPFAPSEVGGAAAWLGRRLVAALLRLALAIALLVLAGVVAPLLAAEPPPRIFTSLEAPPMPEEVTAALAEGVRIFEIDLDAPGASDAVKAIKAGGGRVAAYHVGGGGGRAWGSVKAGEFVRHYNEPNAFLALTEDVRRLVSLGADLVHFDNTHRMSGRRLESVADAIRAGGAGFIAKNNPEKWRLVMKRRADLVPAYAIVEDAMFDAAATQAAYDLHAKGVAVYVVGFRKALDKSTQAVTDEYAAAYKAANPWATVLLMDDEARFDSRTGRFF